jgi:hypothetical protein
MSSSSYTSDSEAGQETDPEPPVVEEKPGKQKKPEKVTPEIVQAIASPEGSSNQVVKQKLSKARREEIIK